MADDSATLLPRVARICAAADAAVVASALDVVEINDRQMRLDREPARSADSDEELADLGFGWVGAYTSALVRRMRVEAALRLLGLQCPGRSVRRLSFETIIGALGLVPGDDGEEAIRDILDAVDRHEAALLSPSGQATLRRRLLGRDGDPAQLLDDLDDWVQLPTEALPPWFGAADRLPPP